MKPNTAKTSVLVTTDHVTEAAQILRIRKDGFDHVQSSMPFTSIPASAGFEIATIWLLAERDIFVWRPGFSHARKLELRALSQTGGPYEQICLLSARSRAHRQR